MLFHLLQGVLVYKIDFQNLSLWHNFPCCRLIGPCSCVIDTGTPIKLNLQPNIEHNFSKLMFFTTSISIIAIVVVDNSDFLLMDM